LFQQRVDFFRLFHTKQPGGIGAAAGAVPHLWQMLLCLLPESFDRFP
jgi:hypothetical protein